jgi:hypothetical protein
MKRTLLILLVIGNAACVCAQTRPPQTDVLGAHLNYGRGCAACHAPHSGAAGNGSQRSADPTSGTVALWGEDVSVLYGKTIRSGGGNFTEVLLSSSAETTPDVAGLLACLSCHDGNYASATMMKNTVYEPLPPTYGVFNKVPTLMGSDGPLQGNYFNDHPMGLSAEIKCGSADGWDCSSSEGVINMKGARSSEFVSNYGFFVKPANYNNKPVVVCTTCHDAHLMSVVNVNSKTRTGLPAGHYTTMFFLRGPYNPASTTTGSNSTAQFCRQCHASESNEMNGGSARTVF